MPSRTTSDPSRFYYLYVLESKRDGNRYIGMTKDLRKRLEEHQSGKSFATSERRPFSLIYYEACKMNENNRRPAFYYKETTRLLWEAQSEVVLTGYVRNSTTS